MTPPLSEPARDRVSRLYERHAADVRDWLLVRYPTADADMANEAAVRAILDAGEAPDGDASVLELRRRAKDRLRSHFRSETRRKAREGKGVTAGADGGPSPLEAVADSDEAERIRGLLAETDEDRLVLDAWLLGVTDPAEVAERLGWWDGTERARTVLARLRKRIQRLRQTHTGGEDP